MVADMFLSRDEAGMFEGFRVACLRGGLDRLLHTTSLTTGAHVLTHAAELWSSFTHQHGSC